MKRICLIDSTYPINTRTHKIYRSLVSKFGYDNVFVIAWNRDGCRTDYDERFFTFEKKAAYGNKIQKLLNLFSFKNYIAKVLRKGCFDVIIASHWETLLLASLVKEDAMKLIYENLDVPTASNRVVLKVLCNLERKALKKTDAIIFASRFFVPLYDCFKNTKIVLENKPDKEIMLSPSASHDSFNIVFLGVIRYIDVLRNLIDAIQEIENIKLFVWGDGPDFDELRDFVGEKENIFIQGRYTHSQLSEIYSNADLVWAVYPNKDFNVKYAISNKFHESIKLGLPCVYANKTELGDYVEKNQIGFTVDPYSVAEIHKAILKIMSNRNLLEDVSGNLKKMSMISTTWEEDFIKVVQFIDNADKC